DRSSIGQSHRVTRRPTVGVAEFRLGVAAGVLQVGRRRDEANDAAHRAGTEQGTLRTAQHLDAIQVEDIGVGAAGKAGGDILSNRNGCLVYINAGRRRVAAAVYAANGNVRIGLL